MRCKMTAKDNDSVLVLHSPSPLKNKNHQIMPFCQSAQELYISVPGKCTESPGPGLRVLSGSITFGTCRR